MSTALPENCFLLVPLLSIKRHAAVCDMIWLVLYAKTSRKNRFSVIEVSIDTNTYIIGGASY